MMNRTVLIDIVYIASISSICLLCNCLSASPNNNVLSQQTVSEAIIDTSESSINNDADIVLTNVLLCYRGHFKNTEHITEGNYDLTKCTIKGELQEPHTTYTISNNGDFCYDNAYDYCADDIECQFSKEKVQEFFDVLNACNLQSYEIYHANSDGVMVTEYPNYYVYDITSNKAYILSEDEYMTALAKADELRTIAEKYKQKME